MLEVGLCAVGLVATAQKSFEMLPRPSLFTSPLVDGGAHSHTRTHLRIVVIVWLLREQTDSAFFPSVIPSLAAQHGQAVQVNFSAHTKQSCR